MLNHRDIPHLSHHQPPIPLLRTQTITQNRPGYRFSSWWLAHSGVCWAVDTSDVGMPVGRDGSPPPPPPSKCNIGAEYRSSHESDCIAAPRSFTFVLCCLVLLPCLFNFSCACLVNFSSLSFTIHHQNLIQHNLSTKQHSIYQFKKSNSEERAPSTTLKNKENYQRTIKLNNNPAPTTRGCFLPSSFSSSFFVWSSL